MKKSLGVVLGVILGFFVLSLGGCNVFQDKTDMSFDQAYTIFVDGLFSSQILNLGDVMENSQINDILKVHLQGGNKDMKIQGDFNIDSLTDLLSGDSKTTTNFAVDRYDKINKQSLLFSGDLEFLFLQNLLYAKIHSFDVDSGSRSAEANLIKLILENYMNTWILMDTTGSVGVNHVDSFLIKSAYQLPQKIQSSLQKHKIFVVKKSLVTQEGKKFFVQVDTGELNLFFSDLGVVNVNEFVGMLCSGMSLDAYFLLENEKVVSLVIDQLSLDHDTLLIQGKLDPRTISLDIENTKNHTANKFSFKERRKSIILDWIYENISKEKTNLSLNIKPQLVDSGIAFDFAGSLIINPLNFNSSVLLDLDGVYRVEKVAFDPFDVPENNLLFNQILGDQFALPSVIENIKE